jgi:hypothetical protein
MRGAAEVRSRRGYHDRIHILHDVFSHRLDVSLLRREQRRRDQRAHGVSFFQVRRDRGGVDDEHAAVEDCGERVQAELGDRRALAVRLVECANGVYVDPLGGVGEALIVQEEACLPCVGRPRLLDAGDIVERDLIIGGHGGE